VNPSPDNGKGNKRRPQKKISIRGRGDISGALLEDQWKESILQGMWEIQVEVFTLPSFNWEKWHNERGGESMEVQLLAEGTNSYFNRIRGLACAESWGTRR